MKTIGEKLQELAEQLRQGLDSDKPIKRKFELYTADELRRLYPSKEQLDPTAGEGEY
jgi:hypothetical protein